MPSTHPIASAAATARPLLKARMLTWEDPAPAPAPTPVVQPAVRADGTRPAVFFSCACRMSEIIDKLREAQQTLTPTC